jgi:hypothetical protein
MKFQLDQIIETMERLELKLDSLTERFVIVEGQCRQWKREHAWASNVLSLMLSGVVIYLLTRGQKW